MKSRNFLACCLVPLLSISSAALFDPVSSQSQQTFQTQLNSLSRVHVVYGSSSAQFQSELYAVNPFGNSYAESRYYLTIADRLVRIRMILESEEASRKLNTNANFASFTTNGVVLDRQISLLSEKTEYERSAALLNKVELTKRQVVFLASQLKDDLGAAPLYFSSGRTTGAGPSTSGASTTLSSAFKKKIGLLSDQLIKDCLAIDSQYQTRLFSMTSSGESLKQQMRSAVGSNKVSDSGTSLYVRNYVNFGGVYQVQGQGASTLKVPAVAPPPELFAVPGRLGQGPYSLNRLRRRQ